MKKNLQVAVCDDEKRAISIISASIKSIFELHGITVEIDIFSSAKELLSQLETQSYSLLFLDINMPGMDGIDAGQVISRLADAPEIVFVSSNTNRVFDTFAIQPFGFVRKNNFLDDIHETVVRYVKQLEQNGKPSYLIHLKDQQGSITIDTQNLKYIECYKNMQMLHIHQRSEVSKLYSRMETLEKSLKDYGFIRIHKGYLVNYAFIRRFDSKSILLSTGEELPVSRSRHHEAMDLYLSCVGSSGVLIGK